MQPIDLYDDQALHDAAASVNPTLADMCRLIADINDHPDQATTLAHQLACQALAWEHQHGDNLPLDYLAWANLNNARTTHLTPNIDTLTTQALTHLAAIAADPEAPNAGHLASEALSWAHDHQKEHPNV